jgi:Arc/MetJ-type ribon-helix-helix transcriptional regulator
MATAKLTTIRLAPEDIQILDAIQRHVGLFSRSDAIRFALRRYAEAEGLSSGKPRPKPGKR